MTIKTAKAQRLDLFSIPCPWCEEMMLKPNPGDRMDEMLGIWTREEIAAIKVTIPCANCGRSSWPPRLRNKS